jgi:TRAP-type C4-dicarboxylate transport system substrate-binding protein
MKNFLLAALLIAAPATARAETLLKLATLAPEGSSWMRLFHEWARAVEGRTDGRIKVKFYAGGVQGDERDVLRKMRLGQIQGAAITAIGLAAIDPEVRALEIARTYEELDGLRAALGETLRKRLEEKGYILGSWGDVGPVHIFSNRPIRTMEDLRQTKLWMWADDPITKSLFETLGLHGVPLGVPDVLPSLSTGAIDAFFGSPLSTLALQWGTHAKYVTSMVMGQATGATVLSKKVWDAIAPEDQKIMREEAEKLQGRVLEQVRADNKKALETMRKLGLEVVPTPAALQKELARNGEAVARAAGKNFSPEFQAQVQKLVDDYRAKHPE